MFEYFFFFFKVERVVEKGGGPDPLDPPSGSALDLLLCFVLLINIDAALCT